MPIVIILKFPYYSPFLCKYATVLHNIQIKENFSRGCK
jgi:hypothetical protein